MKNVLLYFGLFFLVILLLLPPGLRIFGKNLYKKNESPEMIIKSLNCNKTDKTINSTFLNNSPYNFQYKIKGNYLININLENESSKPDENTQQSVVASSNENAQQSAVVNSNEKLDDSELVYILQKYATISYDNDQDISTFTMELNKIDSFPNDLYRFKTFDSQESYLGDLGFACSSNIN